MITLRNFKADDCDFLAKHYLPEMATDKAVALIEEWNQRSCRGAYFEMFVIVSGHQPAGWISLYAHNETTISAGLEVIESARQKGLGTAALIQALAYARKLGYTTAIAQVRKNNAASICLHEKCGFSSNGECKTSQGNEAFLFRLELEQKKQKKGSNDEPPAVFKPDSTQ